MNWLSSIFYCRSFYSIFFFFLLVVFSWSECFGLLSCFQIVPRKKYYYIYFIRIFLCYLCTTYWLVYMRLCAVFFVFSVQNKRRSWSAFHGYKLHNFATIAEFLKLCGWSECVCFFTFSLSLFYRYIFCILRPYCNTYLK